jgi:hypothetical protein
VNSQEIQNDEAAVSHAAKNSAAIFPSPAKLTGLGQLRSSMKVA